MDHSVQGYLQRQSTQTLKLLLENYKKSNTLIGADYLVLIKDILSQRERNDQEPSDP